MPPMLKRRRFAFPHPSLAEAQLEPIIQPLYSMATLDNVAMTTQRETFFFRYAIGQVTSGLAAAGGTVPSTIINTNMDTAGFIASPKVFLCTGTRLIISNLDSTLTDALEIATGSGETPAASMLEGFLEVLYGTYYRFFVGTKDYLTVPTWAVPGNTGVGGVVSTAISGPDAGAAGPDQVLLSSFNTQGKYFSFGEHRILIPSQQNFFTSIVAPQAVPPSLSLSEINLYSVLDGVLGREVQ